MSSPQIQVTVHAFDPLTRAGTVSHLQHEPAVDVVVEPSGPADVASVALVVVHRLDEPTDAELRRLAQDPLRRLVLVADQLKEPEVTAVLALGVRAVVWRADATPSRLVRAIRVVARGERELPQDLLGQLIGHFGRLHRAAAAAPSAVPAVGFAPRELDVLKLVAEGLDTREIASKLTYSERTVKNVLHALMSRLELRNRTHAVAYALRKGYI
jgi:DNA-binding NarL/FixJ family response regulator